MPTPLDELRQLVVGTRPAPVGSEYSAEPHSVRAGLRHGTIGP